jgi:hypothetical protein
LPIIHKVINLECLRHWLNLLLSILAKINHVGCLVLHFLLVERSISKSISRDGIWLNRSRALVDLPSTLEWRHMSRLICNLIVIVSSHFLRLLLSVRSWKWKLLIHLMIV